MHNINSDPLEGWDPLLSRYEIKNLCKFVHFVLSVFLPFPAC
jgi:hypothetical protein